MPLVDLTRPQYSSVSTYQAIRYAVDLLEALNPFGTLKDLTSDLESRYRIWFDAEEWLEWAMSKDVAPEVCAWVSRYPHVLASYTDAGQSDSNLASSSP